MVMIDAMILIYTIGVRSGKIAPGASHWSLASKGAAIVQQTSTPIVVSTLQWFEVLRGLLPEDASAFAWLIGRVRVRPFDVPSAERAAELMQAARGGPQRFCQRCLAPSKQIEPCPDCGNPRSHPQRLNDVLMVAQADADPDVNELYSFDGGVLSLQPHVDNVRIWAPR